MLTFHDSLFQQLYDTLHRVENFEYDSLGRIINKTVTLQRYASKSSASTSDILQNQHILSQDTLVSHIIKNKVNNSTNKQSARKSSNFNFVLCICVLVLFLGIALYRIFLIYKESHSD